VALDDLDALIVNEHHDPYSAGHLAALAQRYMLAGYDTVYFDLARRLGVPLASLDRGQRSACGHHGVKLLTF
jgi:predicted nucleic acid-binding protein